MRKIFVFSETKTLPNTALLFAQQIAQSMQFEVVGLFPNNVDVDNVGIIYNTIDEIENLIEINDAALIIYELQNNKSIQKYLNMSRSYRVPYLFVRTSMEPCFNKIIVPITFLEEDKEKAPFAAAFARFCGSEVTIAHPKDYGTKAKINIDVFKRLFDSFNLNYHDFYSTKDSFKLENSIADSSIASSYGMVIISASREYGLDDILFGSKEKKILQKAVCPILLINPRGDLYALCD